MAYRYWNRGAGQAKTAAAKERYAQNKLAKKFAALGVKNGQLQLPPWIDNWYELAEYLYGDQRYAEQLAAANGGLSILQPGQMIAVPNIPLGLGQDLAVSFDFMVATAQMGAQLAAAGSTNPLAGFDPDYLANQINQGVESGTVSASYAEYLLGGLNYAVGGDYGVAPPLPAGVAGGGEAGALPGGLSGGAVGPTTMASQGYSPTAQTQGLGTPSSGAPPYSPTQATQGVGLPPAQPITQGVPGLPAVPGMPVPDGFAAPYALPPPTMASQGYSPTQATQGIGTPSPPPPPFESNITTTPTEARAAEGLQGPDATLFFPDVQNFYVAFDAEGNLTNPDILPQTLDSGQAAAFGIPPEFLMGYYQPTLAPDGTVVWVLLPQITQFKSSGITPNPNFRPNLLSPWWAYQQRTGWGEFEFTSQQKRDPFATERNGGGGGEGGHGGGQAAWMVGWD